ncbi:MAG: bifunctional diaminohydroxyphosphoribosylaminopyrimidine deaminase/5-amino-6-(5-phosphoribosylamino)uracil reductase RibD [Myxococcota bacterium]|nr:bifunctional diaminohydroxyphosphoribosylaminopyrimidine deaminase/5-amino-6-(5-phosphoribosylamino)uracil reductase RibD [Myxococcota bacterium]
MTNEDWMAECLRLARQGVGRTAPNPMVGAVIVRGDRLLSEGWHRAPGTAHAELDALNRLAETAEGATMYVNLEPCCHQGRTPPCTDAIIRAGIARVVVGQVDPDPRMQGKGIDQLRNAGIEVVVGVMEAESRELNRAYLSATERGRPWVTVKSAITLDGRIADSAGDSQWITSEAARAAGHRLRNEHDAVMVGAGTMRADNPSLTTRIDGGRNAIPVVLDSGLSIGPEARLLHAGERAVVFHADDAVAPASDVTDFVGVPRDAKGHLQLEAVCSALLARGIHSVLVEGGGILIRSLLDHGLVDRIELFIAGKVLAGGSGWVGGQPLSLADAPTFAVVRSDTVGPDVHLVLEQTPCSVES